MLQEKEFLVVNALGLHARAAAQLVKTANKFACDVTVSKDGQNVNGKSIMGVLMLAATCGSTIIVKTDGDDAGPAMEAIGKLVEDGFGEGKAP
ncbi:MAG: HPr family phosphocarrier protein [Deltaproteobacteria bacterium]|nr:HPr family phosphocarrier protein [Deltaproteobacteria bacterium]